MVITSPAQALEVLENNREEPADREAAVRYLKGNPTPAMIGRLVQALQDDEVGVRWEATVALAQLGETALPSVLMALADPKRVDDPRLREGAYHILHNGHGAASIDVTDLLDALRGLAPDIAALVEANRLLRQIEKQRTVQAPATQRINSSSTPQTLNFNPKYGPARLTGRLGRLGGHRIH
jgi:HEAT repeat protein